MTQADFRIERILHAYVDGQLDDAEQRRLLYRMQTDDEVRERVCELRNTKEWVKFSFEGEKAPTRSLPRGYTPVWNGPLLRVAASFLLVVVAFGAGWFGHSVQGNDARQMALGGDIGGETQHVILHIARSDEARFSAVLARAEQILQQHSAAGVQVEVVANAGGLDLMRTASSPHGKDIRRMVASYDNVRFVACSLGLQKIQQAGLDTTLVEGVSADEPAADHLIQRLSEGWTYIRI